MLLKSSHLLSSARMRGFCNIVSVDKLASKGIERDAVFLNRLVKGYMYPFAMKGLQKRCLFLLKWYKCTQKGKG